MDNVRLLIALTSSMTIACNLLTTIAPASGGDQTLPPPETPVSSIPTFVPSPTPELPTAEAPPSDQIGFLEWELKDNRSGEVLDGGGSVVRPGDVYTDSEALLDGSVTYNQNVALNSDFAIGVRIVPQKDQSSTTGFGMFLTRRDIETFSWEWFDFQSNTKADKLQGRGQLEYEVGSTPSGWGVSYTLFLTDVVFRAYLPDAANRGEPPNWTVTIFKDSYVNWVQP